MIRSAAGDTTEACRSSQSGTADTFGMHTNLKSTYVMVWGSCSGVLLYRSLTSTFDLLAQGTSLSVHIPCLGPSLCDGRVLSEPLLGSQEVEVHELLWDPRKVTDCRSEHLLTSQYRAYVRVVVNLG